MPHQLDTLARALRQAQDTRDAQDAAQLIKQASSPLRAPVVGLGLVKRAIAWETNTGPPHSALGQVSQYGVIGLPPGERAIIMKFGHVWKTLQFRDGHSVCDWEGEHLDADAALAGLNQPVKIPRVQGAARRAAG
jgi:hypothetical protein